MAAAAKDDDINNCVAKETFYEAVEELKSKQKTKDSLITLFIDDEFHNIAKKYLRRQTEQQLGIHEYQQEDEVTYRSAFDKMGNWNHYSKKMGILQ